MAALSTWRSAATLFEQANNRLTLADTLLHEGDTSLALHDLAGARAAWQRALDLLTGQRRVPLAATWEDRLSQLGAPNRAEVPDVR